MHQFITVIHWSNTLKLTANNNKLIPHPARRQAWRGNPCRHRSAHPPQNFRVTDLELLINYEPWLMESYFQTTRQNYEFPRRLMLQTDLGWWLTYLLASLIDENGLIDENVLSPNLECDECSTSDKSRLTSSTSLTKYIWSADFSEPDHQWHAVYFD